MPPHDIDAEEAVIGSLLIDGDSIYKIASTVQPEDFYREKNAYCYEACIGLYQRNEAINQVTVAQELARQERLEALGGAAYLSHLLSVVPTSVHLEYYGQIVHRLAMMRKLISAAGQIAGIGYEAGPDLDASLDKAEDTLYRLRTGQPSGELVHIRASLDKFFEDAMPSDDKDGKLASVPSGYTMLDTMLGGMQRSDLLILAARPSLGKTSLALNIARNAALDKGAHTAIFSLEMSADALVQRLLGIESGVDVRKFREGNCNEIEEHRLMDASGRLAEAPIYIDDTPQIGMAEMRSKARRIAYERKLDLIIVDYLQLILGSGKRNENRVQEITEISRSLKALARELNLPVIAVSQLSRAVEGRQSHRPVLSDLRESGSIEQDADVVMFIYRDDAYFTEEEWKKQHLDEAYPKGIANVIIAKHRNGPVGEVDLRFIPWQSKFENLSQAEEDED